jgi:hypothetical protein
VRLGRTLCAGLLAFNPVRALCNYDRFRRRKPLVSGFRRAPARLAAYPGCPKVGLGLWNSVPGTVAVEGTMYVLAIWLYLSATRPRDRTGSYAMCAFILFSIATYIGVVFGPPPPSTRVLVWLRFASWLNPLWAWWFDRHRELRPAA